MLSDEDPDKAGRVMQAMLKMGKIDVRKLKEAYAGGRLSAPSSARRRLGSPPQAYSSPANEARLKIVSFRGSSVQIRAPALA